MTHVSVLFHEINLHAEDQTADSVIDEAGSRPSLTTFTDTMFNQAPCTSLSLIMWKKYLNASLFRNY